MLELFHGPTAAFKDVGARFLAATDGARIARTPAIRGRLTILVATSGDTGGAVAAAFHRPRGRSASAFCSRKARSRRGSSISSRAGATMSARSKSTARSIECQALVKAAFTRSRAATSPPLDGGQQHQHRPTVAAGRLSRGRESLALAASTARRPALIVPSGNLGNGMACVWAQAMGLPIREIVLAVNANRTIPDYLATGRVATASERRDVGLGYGRRQSE